MKRKKAIDSLIWTLLDTNYAGGAKIFRSNDDRYVVQLYYNKRFMNWGINPDVLRRCWMRPKGTVRFHLVLPSDMPTSELTDSVPVSWEKAIPITTLMRKLARTGDFYGDGFYRLTDADITRADTEE